MNVSLYARPVMDHQFENTAPGIALVAHDACKQEMIEWARFNRETLTLSWLLSEIDVSTTKAQSKWLLNSPLPLRL